MFSGPVCVCQVDLVLCGLLFEGKKKNKNQKRTADYFVVRVITWRAIISGNIYFEASRVGWGHEQFEGQPAHQGHCPSPTIDFFQLSITLGGRKKKGIAPLYLCPESHKQISVWVEIFKSFRNGYIWIWILTLRATVCDWARWLTPPAYCLLYVIIDFF